MTGFRCGVIVVLATGALTAGSASATPEASYSVRATLTASQEVPPQAVKVRAAAGVFTGALRKTRKGYLLTWKLTFHGLTGNATSGLVHQGRKGKHGPAIIDLCSPCRSGAHGQVFASPGEVTLMLTNRAYVNVRTKKNPSGEIRGQIIKK